MTMHTGVTNTAMEHKQPPTVIASPWMRIREASAYVRCGPKLLYRSVREGKLKAVRLGGRRDLVFRQSWLDEFLEAGATTEKPV
jgi:excisionase family DNA binding protein